MKDSPCYKCPNRTSECHGKCEAYAEYVDTHPRRDRSEQLWYAYKFEKDKKIKKRMDNR